MSQIQLIEVLCYFRKKGNTLTLSKWINKDYFPDETQSPLQLGLHRIKQDQLNQVRITFEDDDKLQCVLFHKEDGLNWPYGTRKFIRSQLMQLTGYSVRMSRINNWGKSKPDLLYIPLSDNRDYERFFSEYNNLSEFRAGNTVAEMTQQNGVPKDLPANADTVVITDSFLQSLDFLKYCENLKSLIIERCVVNDWNFIREMEYLENLRIETAEIPDSSLVENLCNLKRLSLIDCDLEEVNGLSGKPVLIFCDLSNNHNLSSLEALKDSKELQWLTVENADVRSMDLLPWQQLRILSFPSNCMMKLKNLRYCQELRLIDYTFNWLDDPSLVGIHRMVNEHNLIAFDLCGDLYLSEGLN